MEHINLKRLEQLKKSEYLKNSFYNAREISKVLYKYEGIVLAHLPNIMSIMVKPMQMNEANNNTILILPMGSGKSTYFSILCNHLKKYSLSFSGKMFESRLVKELSLEDFRYKHWFILDGITSFLGLNTKQREQLQGFLNSVLTDGEYDRGDGSKKITNADICVNIAFAKNNFDRYKRELLFHTTQDRFITIYENFTFADREHILRKAYENKTAKHKVKLNIPLKSKKVDVKLPDEYKEEVIRLSKLLSSLIGKSPVRTLQFIRKWLKGNALLNERKEVVKDDILLFEVIMPLFYSGLENSVKQRVIYLLSYYEGKKVLGSKIKKYLMEKFGVSEIAIKKALSELRKEGRVNYEKVTDRTIVGRGYDYFYWIGDVKSEQEYIKEVIV